MATAAALAAICHVHEEDGCSLVEVAVALESCLDRRPTHPTSSQQSWRHHCSPSYSPTATSQ